MLFNFEGVSLRWKRIVGVYDEEVPPVPIPNTAVKLFHDENTWLVTTWEISSVPASLIAPSIDGAFLFYIGVLHNYVVSIFVKIPYDILLQNML